MIKTSAERTTWAAILNTELSIFKSDLFTVQPEVQNFSKSFTIDRLGNIIIHASRYTFILIPGHSPGGKGNNRYITIPDATCRIPYYSGCFIAIKHRHTAIGVGKPYLRSHVRRRSFENPVSRSTTPMVIFSSFRGIYQYSKKLYGKTGKKKQKSGT
jgi:hypothetical protein